MAVKASTQKQVARIIVLIGKKVLLVEKESMPGLFELPGGQRKRNEGFKAAALRELKEETGIVVSVKALRRWGQATLVTTHDSHERVVVTIYTLNLDAKARKRVKPKSEITCCRWLTLPLHLRNQAIERKSALMLKYYHLFPPPSRH